MYMYNYVENLATDFEYTYPSINRCILGCLQLLDCTGLDYWTLSEIKSISLYQHCVTYYTKEDQFPAKGW